MPLYEDIAEEIAERIAARGDRPGDQIEGELQLVEEFGVSRGTVVKALDMLQARGLVRREQGRGTFVHGRAALHATTTLASFTHHVLQAGRRPGGITQGWDRVTADPTDALHSRFDAGIDLVEYSRVRTIDDQPVGIHRVAVSFDVARRIRLIDALGSGDDWSLYGLAEAAGVHVSGGEERYSALLADDIHAELLELELPAALLEVERHTYDLTGVAFEGVQAHYVPGRYSIHAERRRRRLSPVFSAKPEASTLEER